MVCAARRTWCLVAAIRSENMLASVVRIHDSPASFSLPDALAGSHAVDELL